MIPAHLLEVPAYELGRFSADQRASVRARLGALPSSWRPKPRRTEHSRPVGNLLLALKDGVEVERRETRTTIRDLTRKATALRHHLTRLTKASAFCKETP